jgi:hypothetical protein
MRRMSERPYILDKASAVEYKRLDLMMLCGTMSRCCQAVVSVRRVQGEPGCILSVPDGLSAC